MVTRKRIARRTSWVMVGFGSGIVDLYDRSKKFLENERLVKNEVAK